uniref:Uncharacterized protein n=1 Tax=Ananas comosus var. bracteatus TaxID=296719 RepID=A0A6V7NQ48_ANACO|nr:unnamed protein product [Ananas comosus var. bracteatus]
MKLSSYAQMKTDGSTVHLRECDSDLGGHRLDRTYESVVEIGRPSGKVVVVEDRTHWELLLSSSHTLGGLLFRGRILAVDRGEGDRAVVSNSYQHVFTVEGHQIEYYNCTTCLCSGESVSKLASIGFILQFPVLVVCRREAKVLLVIHLLGEFVTPPIVPHQMGY